MVTADHDELLERVLVDAKLTDSRLILEHLARYIFATDLVKGGYRVLDCASGAGYGAHILKNAGAEAVHGYDLDAEAVSWAKTHYKAEGLEFFEQNILTTSSDSEASYDLVTSFETIEHVPDPDKMIKALHSKLKPGGILCISTPFKIPENTAPDGKPYNIYHLFEWTFGEFRQILEKCFTEIEWFTQGLRPIKGSLPFSRSFRARAAASWYKQHKAKMPRGILDFEVRMFPADLSSLVEGKNMLAVCRKS